ncbi:MAG: DNA helicase [Velocimicrobium sp.]
MINEIKRIIDNYIRNEKLCAMLIGTVVSNGIQISEKLVIPNEFIVGTLKMVMRDGQKVRLLRNHGGQQFYILEVIEK